MSLNCCSLSNADHPPEHKVAGEGNNIGNILRFTSLKTINEPLLREFNEHTVYRFWFYRRYRLKCLTLAQDNDNQFDAKYYVCYGKEPPDKKESWHKKLDRTKSAQILDLIKKSNFWETTASIKSSEFVTDGFMYDIEAKVGDRYKEIYCDIMGDAKYSSVCDQLCKNVFSAAGEEL